MTATRLDAKISKLETKVTQLRACMKDSARLAELREEYGNQIAEHAFRRERLAEIATRIQRERKLRTFGEALLIAASEYAELV